MPGSPMCVRRQETTEARRPSTKSPCHDPGEALASRPMTQPVSLSHADGVAGVRITRPPVNALNLETLAALNRIFGELRAIPPAHGLVFASSGGHFCAGLDLKAFANADEATR